MITALINLGVPKHLAAMISDMILISAAGYTAETVTDTMLFVENNR